MAKILIIDDDEMIRRMLASRIHKMGHETQTASHLAEGLKKARKEDPDIVFLDVRLPDGNGLDGLPKIHGSPSEPEVIIITGAADPGGAELAINSGAWDYIQKPFTKKDILLHVKRAIEYRNKKSAAAHTVSLKRASIIGNSPQLNVSLDLVATSAKSDTNVLITGETGAGKELFAKAIHENSLCSQNNFVVVDCTTIPGRLAESLLFGHVKGAFTDAHQTQTGLIQQADGGTLFLDEVGELPLSVQKSFLRVLQERRFKPVGSTEEKQSRFRLVSATNRSLDEMADRGLFRKDLLYRLRTFHIAIPPLRERRKDIESLVLHYIYTMCRHHNMEMKGITPEFLEIMQWYDWPGNVRELISTVEKAILVDPSNPILYPMHLPATIRVKYTQSQLSQKHDIPPADADEDTDNVFNIRISPNVTGPLPKLKGVRESVLRRIETDYLKRLIRDVRGNLDKAAEISGLSKTRLYVLLKKYGISRR